MHTFVNNVEIPDIIIIANSIYAMVLLVCVDSGFFTLEQKMGVVAGLGPVINLDVHILNYIEVHGGFTHHFLIV